MADGRSQLPAAFEPESSTGVDERDVIRGVEQQPVTLRPRSSLWLVFAVWILCALNIVTFVVMMEWAVLVHALPILALVSAGVWVLFGYPAVIVQPAAVVLVNPMRDVRIPWKAVVDVQPGFSLRIVTTHARYRAWAAPGGSQSAGLGSLEANEQVLLHTALPDDGTFAMSALVDPTRAGQSAASIATKAIQRGLQLARAQPGNSAIATGATEVSVRWHIGWLTVLGVLLLLAIVAVAL